jgi:UDP-MurNAc hydroxylase
MRLTSIGHAGLHIETAAGTILCDPWVSPAYFASWFPFPDNSDLDWEEYRNPDFLYVSHLHRDHYDPDYLRTGVSKTTTVLLPDYRTDDLHAALRELGFRRFRVLPNSEQVHLADGLRVMIVALISPSDGPIGDSALAVDDGSACILNQNDAKPGSMAPLQSFGDYDAHFLQFSGANWWPMVYDLPARAKTAFGTSKRANGLARAARYVEEINARYTVPFAGPAAFLDDELMSHNDIDYRPDNPFPDHTVFADYLLERGRANTLLLVPGSTLALRRGAEPSITHQHPEKFQAYEDKERYLRSYAHRARPRISAMKAHWPAPGIDILTELRRWFEPLLEKADRICAGVGAQLLLEIGEDDRIVLDFVDRQVRPFDGEKCRYRFRIERALVERLIADHETDWVNSLFLSMRFQASRVGPYNEFVYTFFKCLEPQRLDYVERWHAQQGHDAEDIQLGDWIVQRQCPHRQADLGHFGELDGDTLRCTMHGYEFDLISGRCRNAHDRPIRARRAEPGRHPAAEQHEVPED